MKRLTLILLISLECQVIMAQPITLRVLGITEYTSHPLKYGYELRYNKNKQADIDLVFSELSYFLDSLEIRHEIVRIPVHNSDGANKALIQIHTFSVLDYTTLTNRTANIGMLATPKFTYAPTDFEAQDALAIAALQDARKQAERIALVMGKKIRDVRYIDDEVDRFWFYLKDLPSLRCRLDRANAWLDVLETIFATGENEEDAERQSKYAIWVGFELVNN
jgi:hypothetical protein